MIPETLMAFNSKPKIQLVKSVWSLGEMPTLIRDMRRAEEEELISIKEQSKFVSLKQMFHNQNIQGSLNAGVVVKQRIYLKQRE